VEVLKSKRRIQIPLTKLLPTARGTDGWGRRGTWNSLSQASSKKSRKKTQLEEDPRIFLQEGGGERGAETEEKDMSHLEKEDRKTEGEKFKGRGH